MKITLKTGIVCALTWIIIKTAYHLIWSSSTELTPMILSNIFFLMASISVGLYLHKKQEGFSQGNAMSDIKAAMSGGVPYALIVSIFLYFYYANINPNFIKEIKKPYVTKLKEELKDDQTIVKLKKQNPELETKSKEEILKEGLQNIDAQTNPKSTSIIALLGMVLMATLYSIVITVIYRKILSRGIAS